MKRNARPYGASFEGAVSEGKADQRGGNHLAYAIERVIEPEEHRCADEGLPFATSGVGGLHHPAKEDLFAEGREDHEGEQERSSLNRVQRGGYILRHRVWSDVAGKG